MNVKMTKPMTFLVAALCVAAFTLVPDTADARPSFDIPGLEVPELESNLAVASDSHFEQSSQNGDSEITGVGANRQKMLIRLGLGLSGQTGLGSGAGRLDIHINGVFEMDNLRFFGKGGFLSGREARLPPTDSFDLQSTGWFVGAGAGYKVTLVGPDLAGVYGQASAAFQSIFRCDRPVSDSNNTCTGLEDNKSPGVAVGGELGGFVHNGNSQVHLGAATSFSTILGYTIGATVRWEYRLFGFAK
ncbi:MAG: hypothetical protein ACQEVA_23525 [Myxococcota bacterium]